MGDDAVDRMEQRRLACSAAPYDTQEIAPAYRDINIFKGFFPAPLIFKGELADPDHFV